MRVLGASIGVTFERAVCSKCGFVTNLNPMYLEVNGRFCANCNEPFPVNFTELSRSEVA